jgi:hypothetical protein
MSLITNGSMDQAVVAFSSGSKTTHFFNFIIVFNPKSDD